MSSYLFTWRSRTGRYFEKDQSHEFYHWASLLLLVSSCAYQEDPWHPSSFIPSMVASIPYLRGFLDQPLQERVNDSSDKMSWLQGCKAMHILDLFLGCEQWHIFLSLRCHWCGQGTGTQRVPIFIPCQQCSHTSFATTKSSFILWARNCPVSLLNFAPPLWHMCRNRCINEQ